MGVGSITVQELVQHAVSHTWSIPEFQRGFVWKPTQVRDLADSLWRNYPVGSLLIWNSPGSDSPEERTSVDGQTPRAWLVDGQQRASALAILFNRKPYWWEPMDASESWNNVVKRYDIRYDVQRRDEPFVVADAVVRGSKTSQFVPVHALLNLDTTRQEDRGQVEQLARTIKTQNLCADQSETGVYSMLDAVTKIRDREIPRIETNLELEDVVHIFELLNRRGTRVTEADVYLAIVAAKQDNRTWVRSSFLPFLKILKDEGFDLDPNLLFRSLTAVGEGKVRFREIRREFWDGANIKPAWQRTTDAWKLLVLRLRQYGVLSDEPLPTLAALVTLVALVDRFPKEPDFDAPMYWLLQASRLGRYSGSATTASSQDLSDIRASTSQVEAVRKLCARLDHPERPLTTADFRRDYTDGRFGRFLLYLLAFHREARDWGEAGLRLGFDAGELARDYRPQWHHIFPVKYLEPAVDDAQINQLANIAVIGPNINIRISAKAPMTYLDQYKITDARLREQLIEPDDGLRTSGPNAETKISDPGRFSNFIEKRAGRLTAVANQYIEDLGRTVLPLIGADLETVPASAVTPTSVEGKPVPVEEDDSKSAGTSSSGEKDAAFVRALTVGNEERVAAKRLIQFLRNDAGMRVGYSERQATVRLRLGDNPQRLSVLLIRRDGRIKFGNWMRTGQLDKLGLPDALAVQLYDDVCRDFQLPKRSNGTPKGLTLSRFGSDPSPLETALTKFATEVRRRTVLPGVAPDAADPAQGDEDDDSDEDD